jgi:hypothetical protein
MTRVTPPSSSSVESFIPGSFCIAAAGPMG